MLLLPVFRQVSRRGVRFLPFTAVALQLVEEIFSLDGAEQLSEECTVQEIFLLQFQEQVPCKLDLRDEEQQKKKKNTHTQMLRRETSDTLKNSKHVPLTSSSCLLLTMSLHRKHSSSTSVDSSPSSILFSSVLSISVVRARAAGDKD